MGDIRPNSPVSDVLSDGIDSLSMRDKTLLKRSVSKHHNNNFKAGYVPVHEQYLHKTGLRGRKTFAFWTLVGLLFILAVGNLILTMTILGVLKLGQGMESLELVPEAYAIKFFGTTDLDNVYKRDGLIEGYDNEPIDISAENGSILMNFLSRSGRVIDKWNLIKNGTHLNNIDSFEVKDKNGNTLFTTSNPSFNRIKNLKNFDTKMIQTSRIVSPVDTQLTIEAKNLSLKGAEGTSIDGKEINWRADQNIYLKTINGSIVISSTKGVSIDKLPIITETNNYATSQYKVCVCMPQGKLFRIPVPKDSKSPIYCNHINLSPKHNPCM